VYQIHWASRAALKTEKYTDRPLTELVPLADTLATLDELRKAGKIRNIGVCNFGVEDLKAALATGVPIVSNQICYNLVWRGIENEVLPFCIANNIAVLPWSPLGQGLLVGKYGSADDVAPGRARSRLFCGSGPGARPQQRHGEPGLEKETFAAIAAMKTAAEAHGTTLTNASLAWLRVKPAIGSVLMGARNVQQLERNLESLAVTMPESLDSALTAAGEPIKIGLGANLDPYESAATTRIV
jgi:aryl-alcohol dehydrogenase-like predicted oxidoreductase